MNASLAEVSHIFWGPIKFRVLRSESVAKAVNGSKIDWPRSIGLELSAQPEKVIVDCTRTGIVVIAPHLVKQFIP